MGSTLIQADIVAWMRGNRWLVQNGYMPRAHAVIGDTPYFLGSIGKRFSGKDAKPAQYGKDGSFGRLSKGFMGKTWDGFESIYAYQDWVTEWAELLLDFVYPGAIIALFGGTRTYHRVAAGLENAGWELFDSVLAWTYGSGFPKAADIGKLIDKQAGANRQVVGAGKSQGAAGLSSRNKEQGARPYADGTPNQNGYNVTAPGTPLAARWEGFKTALKPAYEPIILARAPRGKLGYADLAKQYGTGALNVDAGRVGDQPLEAVTAGQSRLGTFERGVMITPERLGRYPSNMALVCACTGYDHDPACPVAMLDAQSGESVSNGGVNPRNGSIGGNGIYGGTSNEIAYFNYGDSGGASRFFYTAKAPSWEREAGLEAFSAQTVTDGRDTPIDNAYQRGETQRRNTHPTVKPIQLIEWLGRLLLPAPLDEPRRVLIPFAGVGSEMIGAHFAGWEDIVGIEREAEYTPINVARRAFWEQFASYEAAKQFLNIPDPVIPEGQLSIFDFLDEG